jgi:hypothetical protein
MTPWETIYETGGEKLQRFKLDHGWIYKTVYKVDGLVVSATQCFVPLNGG